MGQGLSLSVRREITNQSATKKDTGRTLGIWSLSGVVPCRCWTADGAETEPVTCTWVHGLSQARLDPRNGYVRPAEDGRRSKRPTRLPGIK